MADMYMAGDANRLPWLTDDIERRKKPGGWVAAFLAASAVAIIAALSFWLGMNGSLLPRQASSAASSATIDLSASSGLASLEPELSMPQVEPSPVPPPVALPAEEELRVEAPPVRRVAAQRSSSAAAHRSRPKKTSRPKKAVESGDSLKYASPWKSSGVSGRMVRVGAYASMEKSKDAWSRLAQLSPAIKQLPAVVTDIPSPTGRTLYWLQIGTTSQAHSEVLCQRMRAIGQRCVVVDLAGARKGSKNERQPVGI